jgi:hypothetical protein
VTGSRLAALARRATVEPPDSQVERCELCGEALPGEHSHVLDLATGQPLCACRACALLFDRAAAGGDHYRLIGDRRLRLDGLALDDRLWAALGIPVDLAFVSWSTAAQRPVARYPSPFGFTTSMPAPDAWHDVVAANPALTGMAPDVEGLLVNRMRGAREHWLVPVDDCFRLAARVRGLWSGFGGGDEVWEDIARFFAELRATNEEVRWQA